MSELLDIFEDDTNPLDSVEDILNTQNWTFNRKTRDELIVVVNGKACKYRLFFMWHEEMNALQLCFQYDIIIEEHNGSSASNALRSLNENLWLGHFELSNETKVPAFHYTYLLHGAQKDHVYSAVEDMIDIALVQCERAYSIFQLLASANDLNEDMLSLALMDTAGES